MGQRRPARITFSQTSGLLRETLLYFFMYSSFSSLLRLHRCSPCPAGFECPTSKASANRMCHVGYFSALNSRVCLQCKAGYLCPPGSETSTPSAGACQAGGYCNGRNFIPCPPGTFSNKNQSSSSSTCIKCPSGSFCQGPGATKYQDCPAGHYCPEVSIYDTMMWCKVLRDVERGQYDTVVTSDVGRNMEGKRCDLLLVHAILGSSIISFSRARDQLRSSLVPRARTIRQKIKRFELTVCRARLASSARKHPQPMVSLVLRASFAKRSKASPSCSLVHPGPTWRKPKLRTIVCVRTVLLAITAHSAQLRGHLFCPSLVHRERSTRANGPLPRRNAYPAQRAALAHSRV